MTEQDLLRAGFVKIDDPQFSHSFDMSFAASEDLELEDDRPALLWDNITAQFCVTDGALMFIYFSANTPKEAVDWCVRISSFNPNP